MSIFSPGLVLFDYEPAPIKVPPVAPRKKEKPFQLIVPDETRLRFLKLKTQFREMSYEIRH